MIGGSVGGLLAANLLSRAGWRVTVFERSDGDLGDRGAAVGTTADLLRVMQRIDPAIDASIGVETRSRILLDRSGALVHEVPIRGLTSAWSRLYRPLKDALPPNCYRAGAVFQRVAQTSDTVTAHFADGSHVAGDLLIGADGLHSAVRRQLMPDVTPRYAGYVVWRIVLNERDIPPAVHARIFHHMTFCLPGSIFRKMPAPDLIRGGHRFSEENATKYEQFNELVLCLPMAAPEAGGGRRFQFAWFRPADEARLADLCTDAGGHRHGVSIPPPLIRPELIDTLKADAHEQLAPEIAGLLTQAPQPILQPIFDCEAPRVAAGRVALLGDAAFVARPHVATGVTKAALDAQCLADGLAASDIDAALARYDAERRSAGSRLVARGRYLGAHLEASATHSNRRPEQIIREYGAAGIVEEAGLAQTPA